MKCAHAHREIRYNKKYKMKLFYCNDCKSFILPDWLGKKREERNKKTIETVLPCVPGCDICNKDGHAWGIGGEEGLPMSLARHARERFVRVAFVEIEEKGKRKLALKLNQPPNCEGRHRELLLFPLDKGLDSDEQEERDIRIIRELR